MNRHDYLVNNNKITKIKSTSKGHKEEVSEFIKALINNTDLPISFESIKLTTLTTFKIIDSLATGLPQEIKNLRIK